jgi:Tfp pilus assembly protein PilF
MLKSLFATRNKFAPSRELSGLFFSKASVLKLFTLAIIVMMLLAGHNATARAVVAVPQSSEATQSGAQPDPATSALIAQGFDLLGRNDAADAEATFRKALDARPEIAVAHRGLALALWAEGKGSAAVREMTIATRLASDDPDAHLELGKFAWTISFQPELAKDGPAKSSPDELQSIALREMNKAAALRPQDVNIHLTLARAYLDYQQTKEAVFHAQEAVRLAPSNPTAHVILGQALLGEKEESGAEAEFKKAQELNPNDGAVHLELGQLRALQRRFEDAEKEFRRATELSPNSGAAFAAWAGLLIETGHKTQARGLLEKAVALDPHDWQSQFHLATLLFEGGETARATSLFESVSKAHPEFLPAREQLAFGLVRRGELEKAAAQAEALVAENPQAAEGHHVMALVLWKRRDFDGSLAECALAEANEQNATALLALESLELWQLDRKKEARSTFVRAAKAEPHLGTSEVFCRLIFCDARDIGPVEDFLRKNRWSIAPPNSP